MSAVEDLGVHRASGVLEITGSPSGAIYLDGGHITFARASWVPGLAARLRGSRAVPADLRQLASSLDAQDDAVIAAHVLRRGYLTMARLHELIRSIVVDAFLVLTMPQALDSPVGAVRFAAGSVYATRPFPRLDIGPVRGEAIRRAERMTDCGLTPTAAVALRPLSRPAAVLTRQQWAIARQISGPTSARQLAQRCGTGLADTMDCLGALVKAGLCAPVRVTGQRALPRGKPTRPDLRPAVTRAMPADPRRLTERRQPPSIDVLRQVLEGLRKLD